MLQKDMTDWEKILDDQLEIIRSAANNVDQSYLKVPTSLYPEGIVRERVFCYEFYYQLRKLQPAEPVLTIHGEIDSRGNSVFDLDDQKNPDFVFYSPGHTAKNTIVMEVKGKLSHKGGVIKDFETLLNWVHKGWYEFGLFLLYNHSLEDFITIMGKDLARYDMEPFKTHIFIITLPAAYRAESMTTLDALLDRYFSG